MRRALDAARSDLAVLNDRDAMLDCFFEHSRHLFQFAVLFVLRGDTAHGRNVHGVGAPDGLVKSLTFPVNEPGLFARARELRRPFSTASAGGPVDERLFGSLGRMMPAGLAVPLVVRDRVVAVLLGDGPAESLDRRAHEAARAPIELAKEEMLLWAESVSEALERLILRRKGGRAGSVPPPGLGGSTQPSRPVSAWPPAMSAPPPGALRAPPAPVFRELTESLPSPPSSAAFPPASSSTPPARRRPIVLLAGGAAVLVVAVLVGLFVRGKPDPQRVVVEGSKLAGWPAEVDPLGVRDTALRASGLGDRAELVSVRAEVVKGGRVDFREPAKNAEALLLTYRFGKDDTEAEIRVDVDGLHAPRSQPREMCGDKPCRPSVPAPQCTFAQIWQASLGAGLGEGDRALVSYPGEQAAAGPEWSVSAAGRGRIRLDAATCKPLPRERLRPAAAPLSSIPGAPHAIDPMATLQLARTQSGLDADAMLYELDARGVSRKGLVDLDERGSSILYTFADPPGVAGTRRWRHVKVDSSGISSPDEEERAPGTAAMQGSMPPPPRCSLVHAFEYLTIGTPVTSGTARVTYGADVVAQQSGQWSIEISTVGFRKSARDLECEAYEKVRRN